MSEDLDMREEQREAGEEEREVGRMDRDTTVKQREELRDEGMTTEQQQRDSLFAPDRANDLRTRWRDVQGRFVDDPRAAVKEADGLVDEVIRDLSKQFADERSGLESQWGRDESVSTEDLRVALRRYRSFFERLLSM